MSESNELPRRFTVLLVEDHEDTRVVTAKLIRARGFAVVTASCVADAMVHVTSGTVNFVISDIGLPDGTGYDLMEHFAEPLGINGVALRGYGMQADKDRAVRCGFLEHFTKPLSIPSLDSILKTAKSVLESRGDHRLRAYKCTGARIDDT